MKRPLASDQDAFGHALMDYYLEGRGGEEIIERSDGYLDLSAGAGAYFAELTAAQAAVADRANGRVLDVGCGAGRYALYLQEQGFDVVGIDASPLAVEVCRRRGLRDARLLTLDQVDHSMGRFDTILMLGNNLGLFGSHRGAKRSLKRFAQIVSPSGRIVAQTLDPYQSGNPDHLAYHAQNRAKGRMGGQVRMRVRYKSHKTPWFDYLFVSRDELDTIVAETGWHVHEIIASDGPSYVALIEQDAVTPAPGRQEREALGNRGPDSV